MTKTFNRISAERWFLTAAPLIAAISAYIGTQDPNFAQFTALAVAQDLPATAAIAEANLSPQI